MKNMLIYFLGIYLLSTCNMEQKTNWHIKHIKIDYNNQNISCIKINKNGKVYIISDIAKIKQIINEINSSHVEFIKFGSENTFVLCDDSGNVLVKGFFRKKLIKINGIVYKMKHSVFDELIKT